MERIGDDSVVDRVAAFTGPLLEELAMELVDVEYRREGQGWVLRLFIDKEGGVTVDDCATVSREVSRFLDVEDSIDHAFSLEVSSPGLERPLKKDADFLRFAGRKIRLRLRDATGPDRVLVGILEGMEDARVVLTVEGHRRSVAKEQIAKARLVL